MLKIEMYREGSNLSRNIDAQALPQALAFLEQDPLTTRIILRLEDVTVTIPPSLSYPRLVHSYDAWSGTHHTTLLNDAEEQALLHLAIDGEDCINAEQHYATLANVSESWPADCCPLP